MRLSTEAQHPPHVAVMLRLAGRQSPPHRCCVAGVVVRTEALQVFLEAQRLRTKTQSQILEPDLFLEVSRGLGWFSFVGMPDRVREAWKSFPQARVSLLGFAKE